MRFLNNFILLHAIQLLILYFKFCNLNQYRNILKDSNISVVLKLNYFPINLNTFITIMKLKKIFSIVSLISVCILFSSVYAVEEGSLTVITDPEGIEVWLGDKYLGDSPIQNRKLRTGRYTVKMVDPVQQVSASEEILIQTDQTTVVEKTLKAKFGTLKVESEPEGAEVFIATSLGKTPLENNFMNPGKYRIEIKHPKKKYEPIVEEITIPQSKKVELTNTLVKTSRFDKKAIVRLLLGAGAIGGFVWAIVEQGRHKEFETKVNHEKSQPSPDQKQIDKFEDKAKSAGIQRTVGIIVGSVCVVSFEIVAFF